MTDQTIDGVPCGRDALVVLVETFRDSLHRGKQPTFSAGDLKHFINSLNELRALLDAAPSGWKPCSPELLESGVDCATAPRWSSKEWDGHSHWHPAPAAQPQGEPVAWIKEHWSGKSADFHYKTLVDVVFKEDWKPLYAEQPASVAVVSGGRQCGKASRAALLEDLAKTIYETWVTHAGYVPWVERGNSAKQNQARQIASRTFELALANQVGD